MLLRPVLAASTVCLLACSEPAQEKPDATEASQTATRPTAPKAATPTAKSPGSIATLSVTITPDKLFVRGRTVEQPQLQAKLEALAERSPNATVAVQADATVAEERVTALVKTIKAAGFTTIEVATRPVR